MSEHQAADGTRFVQAWFLFVGPDGELSTDRAAPHISIGATRGGRVRVIVPEGLDISPEVAEHIADRIGQAAAAADELVGATRCPAGRLIDVDEDIMLCRRRAGHAPPHRDIDGGEWEGTDPKHVADAETAAEGR